MNYEQFEEKFAVQDECWNFNAPSGAFVMKADAMPNRFDTRRNEVKLERMSDDLTRSSYGNSEWAGEKRMLNLVHSIMTAKGITKIPNIPLEDFIRENGEVLYDYNANMESHNGRI